MTALSIVCAEYFRARQSEPSIPSDYRISLAVDRANVRSIRARTSGRNSRC
jgi:hypothetical protein